jgi:hypothetical protein
MIRTFDSYPIFVNRKRVDLVLKNISTTGANLKYKGAIEIGESVDFGTSTVEFVENDLFEIGDISGKNSELYVAIGDSVIRGTVVLLDDSELRIVDKVLET